MSTSIDKVPSAAAVTAAFPLAACSRDPPSAPAFRLQLARHSALLADPLYLPQTCSLAMSQYKYDEEGGQFLTFVLTFLLLVLLPLTYSLFPSNAGTGACSGRFEANAGRDITQAGKRVLTGCDCVIRSFDGLRTRSSHSWQARLV